MRRPGNVGDRDCRAYFARHAVAVIGANCSERAECRVDVGVVPGHVEASTPARLTVNSGSSADTGSTGRELHG
jgi:hypothetical protein